MKATHTGFTDYSAFLRLKWQAVDGIVQPAATLKGVHLCFSWVTGLVNDVAFAKCAENAWAIKGVSLQSGN